LRRSASRNRYGDAVYENSFRRFVAGLLGFSHLKTTPLNSLIVG
jgi:hypothetical protein